MELVTSLLGLTSDLTSIVIPTLTTITVFVVGILIDRIHHKWQDYRQTKQFRDAVFIWVEQLMASVIIQKNKIFHFSNSISKTTSIQGERFEFTLTQADNVDFINAENVIKYFVQRSTHPRNNQNALYAYNLVGSIAYLAHVQVDIIHTYAECQKRFENLMNPWNEKIMHLQQIIETTRCKSEEQETYKGLRTIVLRWLKHTEQDHELNMETASELLIKPIINLNISIGRTNFETIDKIVLDVRDLANIYKEWYFLKEGYEKMFKDYASNVSTACEKVDAAKEYFKNYTSTRWWI